MVTGLPGETRQNWVLVKDTKKNVQLQTDLNLKVWETNTQVQQFFTFWLASIFQSGCGFVRLCDQGRVARRCFDLAPRGCTFEKAPAE